MSIRCRFETVDKGICNKPATHLVFCEEHAGTRCCYLGCDRQATHECIGTGLVYCKRPLCPAHLRCYNHDNGWNVFDGPEV